MTEMTEQEKEVRKLLFKAMDKAYEELKELLCDTALTNPDFVDLKTAKNKVTAIANNILKHNELISFRRKYRYEEIKLYHIRSHGAD